MHSFIHRVAYLSELYRYKMELITLETGNARVYIRATHVIRVLRIHWFDAFSL